MRTAELFDLELFELAVQLRQIHTTMRAFHGAEKFARHVADFEPILRAMAKDRGGCVQSAAIRWANDKDMAENMRPLVLAVAVELKLREVGAVMEGARS